MSKKKKIESLKKKVKKLKNELKLLKMSKATRKAREARPTKPGAGPAETKPASVVKTERSVLVTKAPTSPNVRAVS